MGYGATISIRSYGSELMAFRFMGAVPGPDGSWTVRLDPFFFPAYAPGAIRVQAGDVLPLGPHPSVNVKFEQIGPTELVLKATGIHTLQEQN
ncbi:MAG TPA: hypothetical protein VNT75_18805 [Symbiobacteriaceae bacterium]|nr:hypothetical protein [Symbiobacteriaceae bacterium]